MAIVANTFLHYTAKGIREDLADVIANISPEETPFQSNIGTVDVTNTTFEWQTDSLLASLVMMLQVLMPPRRRPD
jgi:hypothetical protein